MACFSIGLCNYVKLAKGRGKTYTPAEYKIIRDEVRDEAKEDAKSEIEKIKISAENEINKVKDDAAERLKEALAPIEEKNRCCFG